MHSFASAPDCDVLVVGAGVVGLSVAYYLAEAGANVTVVDERGVGAAASKGNLGWITPALSSPVPAPGVRAAGLRWMMSPGSPLYIRPQLNPAFVRWLIQFWLHCNRRDWESGVEALVALNAQTFSLFDQLFARIPGIEMHTSGMIMGYASDRGKRALHEDLHVARRFGGDEPRELSVAELSNEEPRLIGLQGAALFPEERHVRPESLTAGLAAAITSAGGNVREGRVIGVVRGADGFSVVTNADTVQAKALVLAAGAWTPQLARMVGARIPVAAGKGYSMDIAAPQESNSPDLRRPVYLLDERVAMSPMNGRLRIGGTMEFTGLVSGIAPRRVKAIARAAEAHVVGLTIPEPSMRAAWSGLRPITPDGLPVIGELPTVPGCFVAAGHSMLGVTLCLSTGRGLAETILSGTSPDVLRGFTPGRFSRW